MNAKQYQMLSSGCARVAVVCCAVFLAGGCGSEKRKAEIREQNESYKKRLNEELGAIEQQILDLQRQSKKVDDELEKREQMWRRSVTERHPEWTSKIRDRQLEILSGKWHGDNDDNVAGTVERMKRFGWRSFENVELVDEDYWDIARARQYRIEQSHDLYRQIAAKLKPLELKKEALVQTLQRADAVK